MVNLKLNKLLAAKLLLTTVLLGILVGIAAADLSPGVPLYLVLFYSALGAVALFAALALAAVLLGTFNQFILRHGGTDTQWFWFKSDLAGLVQLRKEAQDAKLGITK